MHIPFSKYSGCGNDFILIDNRQKAFDFICNDIAQLCHRHQGIGADGVIFLEPSSKADFRMRIFNADGSEAEMCGNGLRCLVRFINELGIVGHQFLIETMHQLIQTTISGEYINIEMPVPTNYRFFDQLIIEETPYTLHFLDTGVPHAVLFVDDLYSDKWMAIAPKIRYHSHFKPKGANVNFAAINSKQEVEIRTYERGVEGETLACGTGATAAAIAAAYVHGLNSPIVIKPKSGDAIHIAFQGKLTNPISISKLAMSGPAIKVFSGIKVVRPSRPDVKA